MTDFCRREAVLCIAAVCAGLSMLVVPPDGGYVEYIDFRVLGILFCLMAVVAGLQECGVFGLLANKLLSGKHSLAVVTLVIVLLTFFSSMFITNDVALITFVPFAVLIFETLDRSNLTIRVVVLQTISANLGSMATPVGNPQNLFLFAHYELTVQEFFSVIAPFAAISLAILLPAALLHTKGSVQVHIDNDKGITSPGLLVLCLCLFTLCLLSVFRILDYRVLTAVVILSLFFAGKKLLLRVDYALLLTFICFFVFSGNLGRIPAMELVLRSIMVNNTMLTSAAASQIISNVPAAVLLAPLTEDWRGLLLGVDIGGLGTPVASLASLISLKLYMKSKNASPVRYLFIFTMANALGLAILLPLAAM